MLVSGIKVINTNQNRFKTQNKNAIYFKGQSDKIASLLSNAMDLDIEGKTDETQKIFKGLLEMLPELELSKDDDAIKQIDIGLLDRGALFEKLDKPDKAKEIYKEIIDRKAIKITNGTNTANDKISMGIAAKYLASTNLTLMGNKYDDKLYQEVFMLGRFLGKIGCPNTLIHEHFLNIMELMQELR